MLSEIAIEMQRVFFINYGKAFDAVKHQEILKMLSRLEVDERDIRLVRKLYYQQRAAVRVGMS